MVCSVMLIAKTSCHRNFRGGCTLRFRAGFLPERDPSGCPAYGLISAEMVPTQNESYYTVQRTSVTRGCLSIGSASSVSLTVSSASGKQGLPVELIATETGSSGTAIGAPTIATTVSAWLRIVKRDVNGQENYTAYSSADDVHWTQSGTWVHTLGSGANDLSVRWKSCWVNCDG